MRTILLTPDTEFEAQVKRAFDGRFDGERRWNAHLPGLDPRRAVETLIPEDAEVVVVGPGVETHQALELAAAVDFHRPDVCVVLVALGSTRLWERALRAGARDLLEPGAPDDVVRETLTLAALTAERRAASVIAHQSPDRNRGRVITVCSSKGGTGKTMVATNLAVGLAQAVPGRVVLVDLDVQFGDVGPTMQLVPHSTLRDAARDDLRLDGTALKTLLEPHPLGLYALCAPNEPEEAGEVSPEAAGHVIDLLAEEFDFVVVDTASGLDEYALAAADRSTDLVVVGATDVPTVKGLRKAVAALAKLGMTGERHFVLNRADARVGLDPRDIEATVGLPIKVAVPSSRAVPVSLNQGSPLIESDPYAPPARSLRELVAIIRGVPAAPPGPDRPGFWARRKEAK